MSQARASVKFNSLCKTVMRIHAHVEFPNGRTFTLGQLLLNVYPENFRIDEAEVLVSVTEEESYRTHIKNVMKERLFNAPRLVGSVAWQPQGFLTKASGEVPEHELVLAKAIRDARYAKTMLNMKPRLGAFVTVLFTIEGQEIAHLTDSEVSPLQIGKSYALQVSVVGLNMAETARKWFHVELKAWNAISVYEDTVWRRLIRVFRK